MPIISTLVTLIIWSVLCENISALALSRTKDYRRSGEVAKNEIGAEPSCEELKAMWRLSKRQSRAAEITNEIPMYKDPFTENVWEPYYPTSRSIGGMRMGRFRGRPIYGRVIHKAPTLRIQDVAERNRAFEELAQSYGKVQPSEPRRRVTAFRLSGGGSSLGFPPQSGSFQHLKELIKTERARELQEQRKAEEAAAKAAVLKELALVGSHRSPANFEDDIYNYGMEDHDRERDSYIGHGAYLPFPDLLAPSSYHHEDGSRFIPDYGYQRKNSRSHASFFGPSAFNTDEYDTYGL